MAPHALAGRQIARLDDSDRHRAPPPRLCGADVPGNGHLRHGSLQDQSRGTARHPGDVAAVGRRRGPHGRFLLAHARPPPVTRIDLPLSTSAVRCRPDHHGRPHDGRGGKRSRQPLRHLHRRHSAADAAGECRARDAVRGPDLLRRRILGACGVTAGIWIQLAVFILVAVVTGYVASRVNVMGAEREALAAEVRQVQLEADDVLRNLRTGVITVDADGRLLYANPASEEILGFRAREWLGRSVMPEFARLAPEFWAAVTSTARRGVRLMRVEATVHRPDRAFPIGVTTTTLDGPVGARPRVSAVFTDISDSKRLEELHLRAERLEAVAELSSSLAHEIKNPLASIRSSVEQLGRSSRANPDEKFLANLIVRESDRLSRLLSEFLDFSRVRVTECRPMDLHQVAQAAIRLVRQHPDCAAGVKITLEGEPTPMEGDEDLLHRVVSNLVLNAVQASGSSAAVKVRTGRAAAHELPGGAGIDNPVALRVSDNGPGIPADLQERLFEPFATGRVGGTGLGLAIVQRAVEAHRGLVLVDTKAGGGTTFTVYFPAARRKEEAA